MHIPDGFLDARTSLGTAVAALPVVAGCMRAARTTLDERVIPLAGIVAAYVFAVQMVNFPVASGTSGHLLGGVLAAVLVGPWLGALSVTVVLAVQALVFADGGLSALGANTINMALVGAIAGYGIFWVVRRMVGNDRRGVLIATAFAAWTAPVLASIMFTAEYSFGGNKALSTPRVLWAMLGVHALIGIGEAVITTLTVAAVISSRPDLVHGAATTRVVSTGSVRRPVLGAGLAALGVAVMIAVAASPFASSSPDGLERVAADHGLDNGVLASPVAESPLAGYAAGDGTEPFSTSVAGLAGVTVTVVAGLLVFSLLRRRSATRAA